LVGKDDLDVLARPFSQSSAGKSTMASSYKGKGNSLHEVGVGIACEGLHHDGMAVGI